MTDKKTAKLDAVDVQTDEQDPRLIERMADLLTEPGQLTIQSYTEEAQAKGPLPAFGVVAMIGERSTQNWGHGDTLAEALNAMLQAYGK